MRTLRVVLLLVAPALLPGQIPRIGVIDYYGTGRAPVERIRQALGVRVGDRLPASKGDVEERLEAVPGVVLARLEAVCCQAGDVILYVGIEERGAAHFEFREAPHGEAQLPAGVAENYHNFLVAFERAASSGDTAENIASGHALAVNPEVRAFQERFIEEAKTGLENLRQVLRTSGDPEQRASAAWILGYAPVQRLVVDDLQYALQDQDEGVRANAMRALSAIAALAARDRELGIRVEPTWFIELLNSIYWSDRRRAAEALVNIAEDRRPAVMEQMRLRSLPSLVEMARWKTLAHALPAFILVGRIAGLSEEQIQEAWTRDDREKAIAAALRKR